MALDFLAGCTGGIAGVMVGYPLDTIKVHLQTQDVTNPKYRGTWHCFTTIVRQQSFSGLYKGMTSPLAGVAVVNAILFGVYGNVQNILPKQWNPSLNVFIAGASAGMVQSVISSPMELAKTRMQLQDSSGSDLKSTTKTATNLSDRTKQLTQPVSSSIRRSPQYKNPLQCLAHLHQTEGFRGVFRGYSITLAREIPAFGSYFVSYDWFCRLLSGHSKDAEMGAIPVMLAGGLSGVTSWVITYPLDVVKSRVQADGFLGPKQYNGTIDCFIKSYQNEGLNAFSRGLTSTVIRAFPTNAATFLAVSMTFKFFGPIMERPQSDKQESLGKVIIEVKDKKKFEELHLHSQSGRIFGQDDVNKMAEISRLTTYAEATFW